MQEKTARSRADDDLLPRASPAVEGEERGPIAIEAVQPVVDCGRFPVKRVVGDVLEVTADVFVSGRKQLRARVRYRYTGAPRWSEAPMGLLENDRWRGQVALDSVGMLEFYLEAWVDEYSTVVESLQKWLASGEDIATDLRDLQKLLLSTASEAPALERAELTAVVSRMRDGAILPEDALHLAAEERVAELMAIFGPRTGLTRSRRFRVTVDRRRAEFAAWYEMFHRSQGKRAGEGATFSDLEGRLADVKSMGFDVVYLPPIHPIGKTNRRGKNNLRKASREEPGSPWAIGGESGGHTAVNPELGTIEEFDHFVEVAEEMGLEVALDLAYQTSPDHPYVRDHPEWFFHRSDGSIRYAENPPKRYLDIYPLRFEGGDKNGLWLEARRVVEFWVARGVKTFRVDNPHTKPMEFWEWLIDSVKKEHPEVIFLSEAFTRPKPMRRLAKLGFSESYTYFTWKNTKAELTEFLTSFVTSDVAEYYRGNFFTNTPDILPKYLQAGGRPAFQIRLVLAATLSSLYGIYNGFELCENVPASSDSEEYLDSEKYEYKTRDWDKPGNIKGLITRVNQIRRENVALQKTGNLRILESSDENIFFYGKWTPDRSNVVLVAVNLDPRAFHEAWVRVPTWELGIGESESYTVRDLLDGREYTWRGISNYVGLDPATRPAHVFVVVRR